MPDLECPECRNRVYVPMWRSDTNEVPVCTGEIHDHHDGREMTIVD